MIELTGNKLTIDDIVRVARNYEKVFIPNDVLDKVGRTRKILEKKIDDGEKIYGVTTGVGQLYNVNLTKEEIKKMQLNMIRSHSATCGDELPIDIVRSAMLHRLNIFCKCYSGVRPVLLLTLQEMINKCVTPIVYEKGSVGASGDIPQLAQMALVIIGEGEAYYNGNKYSGEKAMELAGIKTIELESKEGLSLINGTSFTTGLGALEIYDAINFIKLVELSTAMNLLIFSGNISAYDERIHKARNQLGQIEFAKNVNEIVNEVKIIPNKLHDPYTLRSAPQIVGACIDGINFAKEIFTRELNGASDNPLIFDDEILSGANFQASPLAIALETLCIGITTVCSLIERRIYKLLNGDDLPKCLVNRPGVESGFMILQFLSSNLLTENKVLSSPACVHSSQLNEQEEVASMGWNTALKAKKVIDNAYYLIAIELILCCQAIDLKKLKIKGKIKEIYEKVREKVKKLEYDRPIYNDINNLAKNLRGVNE